MNRLLVFLVGLFALPAFAANPAPQTSSGPIVVEKPPNRLLTKTGYVGGSLGIGTASENVGTGLGYGGEMAFFPQRYLGLGGLFRGANHGTAKSNIYAAQFLLRPVSTFLLGFILGGADVNNAEANSGNALAYGGRASYDFQLGASPFSLGPELDWILYKPNAETISAVNVVAALKMWL